MNKSYKLLIMTRIFPYLLTIYIFAQGVLPYWIPGYSGIPYLDVTMFFLLALVLSVIALIQVIIKGICVLKDDTYTAQDLLKSNRDLKLVQIPAYICNFILAVMALVTVLFSIFTWMIVILDVLSIVLSGIWGTFCMFKLKKEQGISTGKTILYSLLQFIFCFDVISAVLISALHKNQD